MRGSAAAARTRFRRRACRPARSLHEQKSMVRHSHSEEFASRRMGSRRTKVVVEKLASCRYAEQSDKNANLKTFSVVGVDKMENVFDDVKVVGLVLVVRAQVRHRKIK